MENKITRKRNEVPIENRLAWNINETAEMTQIGVNRLRYLNQVGELPCFYIGEKRMFSADAVKDFVNQAAKKGLDLRDL